MTNKQIEAFENLCTLTQEEMFKYVKSQLKNIDNGKTVWLKDGFVYRQGTVPILLVAHMDTVHKEVPREFILNKGILSSPQGIGGDDRCGIYMIFEILKHYNCSVLFTCDEEIGDKGAEKFCNKLEDVEAKIGHKLEFNYIIQLDRRNGNDAVFYDCDNPEFEAFIESTGYYKTSWGTFSDISVIAPELKTAAVNLSCGYYHEHTLSECVNLSEMEEGVQAVIDLIESTDFDKHKFEYIEKVYEYDYAYNDKYFDRLEVFDESEYGYQEPTYWFIEYYTDSSCQDQDCDIICAKTQLEAIGGFLTKHPTLCYNDITDIVLS